jgi:hypothetical protein
MSIFAKIKNSVEATSSLLDQLDEKVTKTINMQFILLIAVVFALLTILLLHFIGLISVNIYPFSTTGSVFVDSPEIYTRERLVNDRYDQDYWLHEQLGKLDQSDSLETTEIDNQVSVNLLKEVSPEANQQPSEEATNQKKTHKIPFDQEFSIRSGIRDTIRQLIMENILDDRHDLTGNSLYGLKFDTTVIPGDYTQKRAFVRVKLEVNDPFNFNQKIEPINTGIILPHQYAYFNDKAPFITGGSLYYAKNIYNNWMSSIQDRLNLYLANKFKTDAFAKTCNNSLQNNKSAFDIFMKEAVSETIQTVLGYIDKSMFKESGNKGVIKIMLPAPWYDFVNLVYRDPISSKDACNVPPIFTVSERSDHVYIFNKKNMDGKSNDKSNQVTPDTYEYGETIFNKRILKFTIDNNLGNDQIYENWENISPRYHPSDALIDIKCNPTELSKNQCHFYIPSGLFNFIERVQQSDFYSYAMFPKIEAAGGFSNSLTNLQLASPIEYKSSLNLTQGRRESQLEPTLVGFSDGGNGIQNGNGKLATKPIQNEIQFGWVLGGKKNMSSTQKAEFALVSVPAWSTMLKLHIKAGWLDRNSNENMVKEYDMQVPLPPDFEALDSLILSDTKFQRKPKIHNNFMESNIKVKACNKAKILIPGTRLWRSTTVTLGAQKADRITVLPNMEGIIAEFNSVDIQHRSEGAVLKTKLKVWTSEGVDAANDDIEIQLPDGVETCPKDPKI